MNSLSNLFHQFLREKRMHEKLLQKEVWISVWSKEVSDEENRLSVEREQRTVRWKKIRELILKKFGSFSGIKTIEIGSGRGIYSLLCTLEGSQSTLLDTS